MYKNVDMKQGKECGNQIIWENNETLGGAWNLSKDWTTRSGVATLAVEMMVCCLDPALTLHVDRASVQASNPVPDKDVFKQQIFLRCTPIFMVLQVLPPRGGLIFVSLPPLTVIIFTQKTWGTLSLVLPPATQSC